MDCFGAGDYVDGQPGVALEVAERTRSIGTEDSIDATCVESEAAEAELEVGHVVAAQHRGMQVEVAVAQPVSGLDQRRQRVFVDEAVFMEAAFGLEAGDLGRCVFSVVARGGLGRGNGMSGRIEAAV